MADNRIEPVVVKLCSESQNHPLSVSIRSNTGNRDTISVRGVENLKTLRDEMIRICKEVGLS